MAKMGRGSRSFLRFRENAAFMGEMLFVQDYSKKNMMEYMHRFEMNDRAVFFAENLQILSQKQLSTKLDDFAKVLHDHGANGVLEFHPTADSTSKSAHIHYWGELNEGIENLIIYYIKEHRLSNKTYLNYTDERMKTDTSHKVVLGELIEYEFDRTSERIRRSQKEVKPVIEEADLAIKQAINRETFYDDIISFCDDILEDFHSEEVERDDCEKLEVESSLDLYVLNIEMEFDLE